MPLSKKMSNTDTENPAPEVKRVTVALKEEVWDKVKASAKADGMFVGSKATELLERGLESEREAS